MQAKTQTIIVYKLGEGYGRTPEGTRLFTCPDLVYYTPTYAGADFYLGDGDTRNGGGTFVGAADMLLPQWRRHLELAEVLWLVPLLERMACGETVEPAEVFRAYKQARGVKPPTEKWHLQR